MIERTVQADITIRTLTQRIQDLEYRVQGLTLELHTARSYADKLSEQNRNMAEKLRGRW